MIEEGYVHDVRLVTLGSFLDGAHLTGSTQLKIMDAADFNEEGGSLILDGLTLDYVSADIEADTLTLASPLGADYEDGVPLSISPLTYEKQAVVVLDGFDEALTAIIPHSLYDRLPDGIREEFGRESVTIELQNSTWKVSDVYGKEPVIDGSYLENVVADDIIDGIVTEVKLANEAVSAAKLAANSVTETKIANDAVTTPKLVAGAVSTDKLAAGSVVADKIASAAITTAKLDALAVTADKIAANAITASKILAGTITGDRLDVNALIGKTAQSSNFVNDPETGITGWQFNADGSAYIRSATIGNDLYEINETGNAAFQSVSVNSLFVDGEDFEAYVDNMARGVLNVYPLSGAYTYAALDTEYLITRFVIPSVEARMYKITLDNFRFDRGTGTSPTQFQVNVYSDYDGTATNADYNLHSFWRGAGYTASASDDIWSSSHVFSPSDADLGKNLSIAVYSSVNSVSSTPRLQMTSNSRVVVEDCGGKVVYAPTVDITNPADAKTTYTKTYSSTWMGSWGSANGKRTDSNAYQGNYSGTWGNNYSKYGFSSSIQTDLTGATVKKVELYLDNNHFYSNSGGNAIIGTHANSTEPTGSSSTSGTYARQSTAFTKGQAKWVTLSSGFGTDLKSGAALGITLGRTSGGTLSEYGYFSSSAKLRITYEK
jgi:hypothetical protein